MWDKVIIVSAGVITTRAIIDYETTGQTNFVLKVTVTDTIATATSTITLTIIDLNEAPALNSNTYRTNVNDGAVMWFIKNCLEARFC